MHEILEVTAASRLHFGLLSFGHPDRRQHGGVGMMIDCPRLVLRARPAERFHATGPASDRLTHFARTWQAHRGLAELPACHLTATEIPRQHTGLGVGTQLALSVARLLDHSVGVSSSKAADLARSVGRGMRSSVGAHGFCLGGLIYEEGKRPHQALAALHTRVELPCHWRVVCIDQASRSGLSGPQEHRAFRAVPPVPEHVTVQLREMAEQELLPAAEEGLLDEFGETVYRYGLLAGSCFAAVQDGPFASQQLECWVQKIRNRGVRGVGQSSWGPTLFAIFPGELKAREFVDWFRQDVLHGSQAVHITVAAPQSHGATLCTIDRTKERSTPRSKSDSSRLPWHAV